MTTDDIINALLRSAPEGLSLTASVENYISCVGDPVVTPDILLCACGKLSISKFNSTEEILGFVRGWFEARFQGKYWMEHASEVIGLSLETLNLINESFTKTGSFEETAEYLKQNPDIIKNI